ncbi:hypothetical protein ETAA8_69660 [Anatilimnocola aggregata]|uniref:DUF3592 domain-containing protein n=1 Tax=Anatilimnocola aggregata TaxID=2528021 RepID=A0A517YNM2_9BACT|nr:DUF3592 domain-containing protein [Anatilimnocola aggregata]QDU31806.1 hypothetical protein ETAA8_69660 [Anatilimnocola aggregata]
MPKIGCGGIFSILFATYWCGITFLADGLFISIAVQQLHRERYSVTQGTVTYSNVKVESDGEVTSYRPEVRFRFQVADKEYEGRQIRYDYSVTRKDRAYEVISNYPILKTVTVYYYPDAPADAVLEKDLEIAGFYGLLFLTPFNAISLGFIGSAIGGWRAQRLGQPLTGVSVQSNGLNTVIRIYKHSPILSAFAAWGGVGFLMIFGVNLLDLVISLESAVILGWLVTLAAPLIAWWQASKHYLQIRHDMLRGMIEIRETDGRVSLLVDKDLQPARYSRSLTTDNDGEKSGWFTVELPFCDPATNDVRTLTLPEQTSQEDAERFVRWLNGQLRIGDTLT